MSSFENTGKIEPCFRRCSSLTALTTEFAPQTRTLSRSRILRSKRHADGTFPAHKCRPFQNFTFYSCGGFNTPTLCGGVVDWSRKELESFRVVEKLEIEPKKFIQLRCAGATRASGWADRPRSECSVPSVRSAVYPPFGV